MWTPGIREPCRIKAFFQSLRFQKNRERVSNQSLKYPESWPCLKCQMAWRPQLFQPFTELERVDIWLRDNRQWWEYHLRISITKWYKAQRCAEMCKVSRNRNHRSIICCGVEGLYQVCRTVCQALPICSDPGHLSNWLWLLAGHREEPRKLPSNRTAR